MVFDDKSDNCLRWYLAFLPMLIIIVSTAIVVVLVVMVVDNDNDS